MHALIVGPRGVGKSTLIRRVLQSLDRPMFGYETRKEETLADGQKGAPVYFYEVGKPRCQTPENLLGYCGCRQPEETASAFDRLAPGLESPVPRGSVVKLDEIGFLESGSEDFCRAVIKLLDGSNPVIAAVKDRDIPFLQEVRSHPNTRCFYITQENRDRLYEEVLEFMEAQMGERLWHEKH